MNAKEVFYEKLGDIHDKMGKNNKALDSNAYNETIRRLNLLKQPGHTWVPGDYALTKKYELVEIEKNGEMKREE